jgi:hypothetical protein
VVAGTSWWWWPTRQGSTARQHAHAVLLLLLLLPLLPLLPQLLTWSSSSPSGSGAPYLSCCS